MKKIAIGLLTLVSAAIAPNLSAFTTIDFSGVDFSSAYQLTEFSTDLGGLSYTLTVEPEADPVTALAVGFDGEIGYTYTAGTNLGWNSLIGTEGTWSTAAAQYFGGISWTTFLELDPVTKENIDHFALYWTDGVGVGSNDLNEEDFWVTSESTQPLPEASPFVVQTQIGAKGGATGHIPEPSSIALLGLGLLSFGLVRRRSAS